MALATTWVINRLDEFLLGLRFTLETNHKPLVKLFRTANLDLKPPRIQRFSIRHLECQFDVKTCLPVPTATDLLALSASADATLPNADARVEILTVGMLHKIRVLSAGTGDIWLRSSRPHRMIGTSEAPAFSKKDP
ncbi:hypothetical protein MTO96_031817 [Rhipicephalus appendiculatus]